MGRQTITNAHLGVLLNKSRFAIRVLDVYRQAKDDVPACKNRKPNPAAETTSNLSHHKFDAGMAAVELLGSSEMWLIYLEFDVIIYLRGGDLV